MRFLLYISRFMIPLVIVYMITFGLLMKRPVYDDFAEGAKEGARTVMGVFPTLVGLMVGTGILRASGLLEWFAGFLAPVAEKAGVPSQLIPVAVVKLFSSSAATGLALDIFKEYGPDSQIGLMVSLLLSCTETIFYTMSLYFMTAEVKKTRYTLPGALMATVFGMFMSILMVKAGFL